MAPSASPYIFYLLCPLNALCRLSSILISRFILNLRQIHLSKDVQGGPRPSFVRTLADNGHSSQIRSHSTSLKFASSIVGNMGAPLGHSANSSQTTSHARPLGLSTDTFALCQYSTVQTSKLYDNHDTENIETSLVADEPLSFGVIPFEEGMELRGL